MNLHPRHLPTRIIAFFIVALVSLFAAGNALAWTGLVVEVIDGDGIKAVRDGRAIEIRLNGIDCPEYRQPYGQEARKFLRNQIFARKVRIDATGIDKYNRTLAWIYSGERNINLELVKRGLAWHYKYYSSDPEFAQAEIKAREARIGLWRQPNPIPPWEYRDGRR